MKTLSYVLASEEDIVIGGRYYFGQLCDGEGNAQELLESGCVIVDGENIIAFKQLDEEEDVLKTLVEVVDIY